MRPARLPFPVVALAFLAVPISSGSCGPNARSVAKLPGSAPQPAPTARLPDRPGNPGPVGLGLWGGPHIEMTVEAGGARITFDCATATVDQSVQAGTDGFFFQTGRITPLGGPVPAGGRPSYDASYFGAADDRAMQLTVTYVDGTGVTRSDFYELTHDQGGTLNRCF